MISSQHFLFHIMRIYILDFAFKFNYIITVALRSVGEFAQNSKPSALRKHIFA